MDNLVAALPSQPVTPSFWDYLYRLRVNSKLCDIQLLIRNKHPLEDFVEDFAVADCIQAHKLILTASSQFFRKCLEKGDLLSVYNFDGVQSKNMQLLVDYMYHQVSWEDVQQNEEAAEVARILEVLQHQENTTSVDYPKDIDGNRVLIVRMQDVKNQEPKVVRTSTPRTKRVIVDDMASELKKHNITGVRGGIRKKKKVPTATLR